MQELRKPEEMTERDLHILEMAQGLRYDWLRILMACDRGPRTCRREVRRYTAAHVKTICEIANVIRGGKIGEMLREPKVERGSGSSTSSTPPVDDSGGGRKPAPAIDLEGGGD